MNILYFMKRWPRNNESTRSEKILSLSETLVNLGHSINFVSADTSPQESIKQLKQLPFELININQNKISSSLTQIKKRPDIAIFNSSEMQEMYSIHLYTKWNKCFRILEMNQLQGLQKWRKQTYNCILNYGEGKTSKQNVIPSYPNNFEQSFTQQQYRSIVRSDFYFCGNDFISFYLKQKLKIKNYILSSIGYPLADFRQQIEQLHYRSFSQRKNFVFLADLSKQKNRQIIQILINKIWPFIRAKLTTYQLHIYGSGLNKEYLKQKQKFTKNGVYFKGKMDDIETIQEYKALLYPVQNTCGYKGSIVDAWFNHTPVITTPFGAEGFFEDTSESSYAADSKGDVYNGFLKQRIFTQAEKLSQNAIKVWYQKNNINQNDMNFGGLYNNLSYYDFANSAIQMATNESLWNKCLDISHRSLYKHHSERQLEINLNFGISQMELNNYSIRKSSVYTEEWGRYLKSRQGHEKLFDRKVK